MEQMTDKVSGFRERLAAARVHGRGRLARFLSKSKVGTATLLLGEAMALTPASARSTPFYQKRGTWLTFVLAANTVMVIAQRLFWWAGGFDVSKHMVALGPFDGAEVTKVLLNVAGLILLGGAILGWYCSDHLARIIQPRLRLPPVRPAPFCYYLISGCATWMWMGLAIFVIGIFATPIGQRALEWATQGSAMASAILLGFGLAIWLGTARARAARLQYEQEVYGGWWPAARAVFLFQIAPLVGLATLLVGRAHT